MDTEHGWDYNTKSGPPQSWDHGKDAQSYYHVITWLDTITKSDTSIGNEELRSSIEGPFATDSDPRNLNALSINPGALDSASHSQASEAPQNFLIIGHDDKAQEVKKVSGAGDGWVSENTIPGIVEDGRIWRGVKTFRAPTLHEIQVSEEPDVGSESGMQVKTDMTRGGDQGRHRGRGRYRGRGNLRGANRGGVSSERWAATRGW